MKLILLFRILLTENFEGANFQCFCILIINHLRTFFRKGLTFHIGKTAIMIKTQINERINLSKLINFYPP